MKYFASFISGCENIVENILQNKKQIKILEIMSGGVVFESSADIDISNFFCFNNIFEVLKIQPTKSFSAENFAKTLINFNFKEHNCAKNKNQKSFRLVVSNENALTSLNANIKIALENKIKSAYNLKIDRANCDVEFWILYRSEGYAMFLKRLTKHKDYKKILNKGELHGELAYMMCYLAKNNLFGKVAVDSFCGYASILKQALIHFKVQKIYGFDINRETLLKGQKSLENVKNKNYELEYFDVKNLCTKFESQSVDAVVTDPPWGVFENIDNIEEFYFNFLQDFAKVLKIGGTCVLLTAKKQEMENILPKLANFKPVSTHHILVSGKKSAIYVLERV